MNGFVVKNENTKTNGMEMQTNRITGPADTLQVPPGVMLSVEC